MHPEDDNAADDSHHEDLRLPGFPHLASATNDDFVDDSGTHSDVCIAAARHILNRRRLRLQMLDPNMFGEPAWDMLLLLIVNEASNLQTRRVCLTQALHIPDSVAFRWRTYLERQGLIHFLPDESVRLTSHARRILTGYLTKVSGPGTIS